MVDVTYGQRLLTMCRTALTFAPVWGAEAALEHVRVAVHGEGGSDTWERGRRLNRRAFLGSQLVGLRERIQDLEKLARRTPPRTLHAERQRVREAGARVEALRAEEAALRAEYDRLVTVEQAEHASQAAMRRKHARY